MHVEHHARGSEHLLFRASSRIELGHQRSKNASGKESQRAAKEDEMRPDQTELQITIDDVAPSPEEAT